jgi:3-hydroxyacyl-[acyl-carrier-protein] dehydratase
MWYEMTILHESDRPGYFAAVQIPADSPWFSGHFPGHPVLPGIAQLGMVMDLVRRSSITPMELEAISRVRFKKMVGPLDRITVEVVPKADKADQFTFRIRLGDELVSNGNLKVRQRTP